MSDEVSKKYEDLIKKLTELKKTLKTPEMPASRKKIEALGAGWYQDIKTGSFHHNSLGQITTTPHKKGGYEIKHNKGTIGRTKTVQEAGIKIKDYVSRLGPHDTNMHNHPSPEMAHAEKTTARLKKYSPAELAAIEEAQKLKNNFANGPWVDHSKIPSASESIANLSKNNPIEVAEDMMATQLANLMSGRAMLGSPPKQPTDQEMFGHLVPSEEVIKSAEDKWSQPFDWLKEASKPISSKFVSEEEEQAYWSSIKVSDRDDGSTGY